MIRSVLFGLTLGLFVVACTPRQIDQTAGTIANVDLIRQCDELRLEKVRIKPMFGALDDGQIDRLEEINAVHRVICTADLRALTAEVRKMREDVE